MNTSYLGPLQLKEAFKVVAIDFQPFMRTVNYCLGDVCYLNIC